MKRALIAGAAYFGALFALGFILGTIRVMITAPRFGVLTATALEVPVMVGAGFALCRWAISRWHVPRAITLRGVMVIWFLFLLALFETGLGALLFGRSASEQWAAFSTPAGAVGTTAQIITALLPLFVGRSAKI